MKRKLFIALFFLFSLSLACGLSFNVNKAALVKGETLEINGYCNQHSVEVQVFSEGRMVFSEETLCGAGKFFFAHPIDFLDPSGLWDVNVSGMVRRIKVSSSRESQFLVIKFLSPGRSLERTQDFNITIALTDAGEPVLGAEVVAWLPGGQRIKLLHKGKGIYSFDSEVPIDAGLGLWHLTVAAKKPGTALAGGEDILEVAISQAHIEIEIFEPAFSTYDLGDSIPLKVRARYASGKPLQDALALLEVKGQTFALGESDSFFEGSYLPREQDTGTLELAVNIIDAAGNSLRKSKSVVVVKGVLWYVKTLAPLAAAVLVALFAIIFISRRILVKTKKEAKLQSEKKELLSAIKGLQKEYLKGNLAKDIFREESGRLEKRLKEVRQELRATKQGKRTVKKKFKKK